MVLGQWGNNLKKDNIRSILNAIQKNKLQSDQRSKGLKKRNILQENIGEFLLKERPYDSKSRRNKGKACQI